MTTMTNRQAEDNELTAWSFWWLRVEGVDGGGGQRIEASCACAWLQQKHHLHQGMESKHAQESYGYQSEKPSSSLAAEIKDLLLMSRRFAFDLIWRWLAIMNHFHKHSIVHKEGAQLAHMNALCGCTVFVEGGRGGGGGCSCAWSWVYSIFMTPNDTFSACFVDCDAVQNDDQTVQYLGVRGGLNPGWVGRWAPHKSRISHPGNNSMLRPARKRRGDAA